MRDRDGIIEVIQALLAKTEANGATEAEASSAAAKAQELLARHNLAMAEVEPLADNGAAGVTEERIDANSAAWRGSLCKGIAGAMFCRVVRCGGGWDKEGRSIGYKIAIIGAPENVGAVRELFRWLEGQVDAVAARECRGMGRRYANSFRLGMAQRLGARIREQAAAEAAQSVAMRAVVVHHEAANRAFVVEHYPGLVTRRASASSGAGMAAGQAAGNGVGLASPRRQIA